MNYTSIEIQDISSDFRNIARRLSRTDHSQCDANLKRFMAVINSNPLIKDFISEKNTKAYDIAAIIKGRGWLDPFEVSPDVSEEISLEYQLLTYALDNYNGDFTRLYGTYNYTSAKSTVNDEMNKFIEHIIDPLIDHISEHIRRCYENAVRNEPDNKTSTTGGITANYSTVVVGSTVEGNISTQVSINDNVKNDATDIIASIKEIIDESSLADKDDIKEVLQQIEDEVNSNKTPKKGVLTALKTLCSGLTSIAPLITTLIKLFFPS